jgi:uncharacterized protein (TIGR02145 family)
MKIVITLFILLAATLVCTAQKTAPDMTVEDVDGNVYNTVIIDDQIWMAENLRTTKLNDGTPISLVTENSVWRNLITPGYCYYKNAIDADSIHQYGALYNWYTVDTKKLAPKGWHVPSDAEWQKMIDFLGGKEVAGGKMKSTGTTEKNNGLWSEPNTNATNESFFSAYPGGGRFYVDYYNIDKIAYFWTSSERDNDYSWGFYLHFRSSEIYLDQHAFKYDGLSVRCVKD